MTRIQVTPGDLIDLAARLTTIHDDMKGEVGGVDGGAAHGAVVGAVSHFHDRWDYSMGKIADAAGTAAQNLKNAARGYTNADHSLTAHSGGR